MQGELIFEVGRGEQRNRAVGQGCWGPGSSRCLGFGYSRLGLAGICLFALWRFFSFRSRDWVLFFTGFWICGVQCLPFEHSGIESTRPETKSACGPVVVFSMPRVSIDIVPWCSVFLISCLVLGCERFWSFFRLKCGTLNSSTDEGYLQLLWSACSREHLFSCIIRHGLFLTSCSPLQY